MFNKEIAGCSNITDEMFEKICRVCTKLRIVDTSGCPSIYSYSEILKVKKNTCTSLKKNSREPLV